MLLWLYVFLPLATLSNGVGACHCQWGIENSPPPRVRFELGDLYRDNAVFQSGSPVAVWGELSVSQAAPFGELCLCACAAPEPTASSAKCNSSTLLNHYNHTLGSSLEPSHGRSVDALGAGCGECEFTAYRVGKGKMLVSGKPTPCLESVLKNGRPDSGGIMAVCLPSLPEGGTYQFKVWLATTTGRAVSSVTTIRNIAIGDVYFFFGQSNMVEIRVHDINRAPVKLPSRVMRVFTQTLKWWPAHDDSDDMPSMGFYFLHHLSNETLSIVPVGVIVLGQVGTRLLMFLAPEQTRPIIENCKVPRFGPLLNFWRPYLFEARGVSLKRMFIYIGESDSLYRMDGWDCMFEKFMTAVTYMFRSAETHFLNVTVVSIGGCVGCSARRYQDALPTMLRHSALPAWEPIFTVIPALDMWNRGLHSHNQFHIAARLVALTLGTYQRNAITELAVHGKRVEVAFAYPVRFVKITRKVLRYDTSRHLDSCPDSIVVHLVHRDGAGGRLVIYSVQQVKEPVLRLVMVPRRGSKSAPPKTNLCVTIFHSSLPTCLLVNEARREAFAGMHCM